MFHMPHACPGGGCRSCSGLPVKPKRVIYSIISPAQAVQKGQGIVMSCSQWAASETNGAISLAQAVKKGNLGCIEALVRAGADVNRADDERNTPIMVAAHKGEPWLLRRRRGMTTVTSQW